MNVFTVKNLGKFTINLDHHLRSFITDSSLNRILFFVFHHRNNFF